MVADGIILLFFLLQYVDISGNRKPFVASARMPEVLNINISACVALSISDLMKPNFVDFLNSKIPGEPIKAQPLVEYETKIPPFVMKEGSPFLSMLTVFN